MTLPVYSMTRLAQRQNYPVQNMTCPVKTRTLQPFHPVQIMTLATETSQNYHILRDNHVTFREKAASIATPQAGVAPYKHAPRTKYDTKSARNSRPGRTQKRRYSLRNTVAFVCHASPFLGVMGLWGQPHRGHTRGTLDMITLPELESSF